MTDPCGGMASVSTRTLAGSASARISRALYGRLALPQLITAAACIRLHHSGESDPSHGSRTLARTAMNTRLRVSDLDKQHTTSPVQSVG